MLMRRPYWIFSVLIAVLFLPVFLTLFVFRGHTILYSLQYSLAAAFLFWGVLVLGFSLFSKYIDQYMEEVEKKKEEERLKRIEDLKKKKKEVGDKLKQLKDLQVMRETMKDK